MNTILPKQTKISDLLWEDFYGKNSQTSVAPEYKDKVKSTLSEVIKYDKNALRRVLFPASK